MPLIPLFYKLIPIISVKLYVHWTCECRLKTGKLTERRRFKSFDLCPSCHWNCQYSGSENRSALCRTKNVPLINNSTSHKCHQKIFSDQYKSIRKRLFMETARSFHLHSPVSLFCQCLHLDNIWPQFRHYFHLYMSSVGALLILSQLNSVFPLLFSMTLCALCFHSTNTLFPK